MLRPLPKWQKTQLLRQNSSILLNRSLLINMLFPCSIYCLGVCTAVKNQEQGIRRKEKLTEALIVSMQHTNCALNFLARFITSFPQEHIIIIFLLNNSTVTHSCVSSQGHVQRLAGAPTASSGAVTRPSLPAGTQGTHRGPRAGHDAAPSSPTQRGSAPAATNTNMTRFFAPLKKIK